MAEFLEKMASSRPADTNEAELYQVDPGESIIGVLSICNQTSNIVTYRVAFTDGDAAAVDEWEVYDTDLHPHVTHQITNIMLQAGYAIAIQSGTADAISFVLRGIRVTS